jgi:hypothetical protein
MRIGLGRAPEAAPLLVDVVAGARERDDPWLLGHGLTALAMTRPADDPGLAPLLEEGVAALRRSGDSGSIAYALVPLGDVDLLAGDLESAVRRHEEALRLARAVDDGHLVATLLDQLALDALLTGDLATTRRHLAEAATRHRQERDQEGLANCLDALAGLLVALGDAATAARLTGAAAAARAQLGVAVWPLLRSLADRLDEAIGGALGEDERLRQRAAGAELDPWTALELGLAAAEA